ncbi:phasin family protein [Paraburkholderia sp. RL18-101-BIB-B]|uniref:phasin family protein n=1 Tax=Paraburkholderia sp. RL18-101-BIB-B TaxID=3031634 RepID=UPI0038B7DF81
MLNSPAEQPFFRQGEATIGASSSCAEEISAGLEKVIRLNMQTAKTAVAEQRALADAALSAHSLSEVIDLQSQQLPVAVKKSFAYGRHVEDIAVQTGTDLLIAMQEHIGPSGCCGRRLTFRPARALRSGDWRKLPCLSLGSRNSHRRAGSDPEQFRQGDQV